ncbi:flagellin [Limimonas halophila]|uniref:Flagellin n=1 Tax=Limimonas halophila TaxID=1082479 RepID=A0A1G7Q321_9PROT|nr:flagellin [Limimonas halophila]SDF92894.1 flagellin [Limimonas halophila]
MSLSIVSNAPAAQANQQLNRLSDSLQNQSEVLSSGLRVNEAQDDVASSAISSRLEAEVSGLEQANRNAEQAGSLLQIADGAFSNTESLLQRGQQLAVQAGSDNISDPQREFLDSEFQAIQDEINRLAEDTTFSGSQLVSGNINATNTSGGTVVGTGAFGAMGVTFSGSDQANPTFMISSAMITANATGTSLTGISGGTGTLAMLSFMVTGVTTADGNTTNFSGMLTNVMVQADTATPANVQLTMAQTIIAGPTGQDGMGSFSVMLGTGTTIAMTDLSSATTGVDTLTGATFTGSDTTMLNFAVGTGTDANADQIEVTIGSIDTRSLGIDGTSLDTRTNAEQANQAIDNALQTLNQRRSEVAASQNRLDAAQDNISSAINNQSAANSSLIEANVAQASTEFSQTQVRFQAASSTLTQAQQLPQNLLGLFQ